MRSVTRSLSRGISRPAVQGECSAPWNVSMRTGGKSSANTLKSRPKPVVRLSTHGDPSNRQSAFSDAVSHGNGKTLPRSARETLPPPAQNRRASGTPGVAALRLVQIFVSPGLHLCWNCVNPRPILVHAIGSLSHRTRDFQERIKQKCRAPSDALGARLSSGVCAPLRLFVCLPVACQTSMDQQFCFYSLVFKSHDTMMAAGREFDFSG